MFEFQGGLAKWFTATVSKTVLPQGRRRFESCILRHMPIVTLPCGKEVEVTVYGGRENREFPYGAEAENCQGIPHYGFGPNKRKAREILEKSLTEKCPGCQKETI